MRRIFRLFRKYLVRQIRQTKIEIEMWNCFLRIEQDITTINNSVEGWHNCFTLSGKHPSIWRFIEALRKEESIKIPTHCSGGVKFYCLGFTAAVSGEMCPASIHRHRCSVWGPVLFDIHIFNTTIFLFII